CNKPTISIDLDDETLVPTRVLYIAEHHKFRALTSRYRLRRERCEFTDPRSVHCRVALNLPVLKGYGVARKVRKRIGLGHLESPCIMEFPAHWGGHLGNRNNEQLVVFLNDFATERVFLFNPLRPA